MNKGREVAAAAAVTYTDGMPNSDSGSLTSAHPMPSPPNSTPLRKVMRPRRRAKGGMAVKMPTMASAVSGESKKGAIIAVPRMPVAKMEPACG